MKYFVVVYNPDPGELRNVEVFADGARALDRRMELERRINTGEDTEIVILVAPDSESLKRTHARYFKSERELLENASRQLVS
jgi:hypothetical protein